VSRKSWEGPLLGALKRCARTRYSRVPYMKALIMQNSRSPTPPSPGTKNKSIKTPSTSGEICDVTAVVVSRPVDKSKISKLVSVQSPQVEGTQIEETPSDSGRRLQTADSASIHSSGHMNLEASIGFGKENAGGTERLQVFKLDTLPDAAKLNNRQGQVRNITWESGFVVRGEVTPLSFEFKEKGRQWTRYKAMFPMGSLENRLRYAAMKQGDVIFEITGERLINAKDADASQNPKAASAELHTSADAARSSTGKGKQPEFSPRQETSWEGKTIAANPAAPQILNPFSDAFLKVGRHTATLIKQPDINREAHQPDRFDFILRFGKQQKETIMMNQVQFASLHYDMKKDDKEDVLVTVSPNLRSKYPPTVITGIAPNTQPDDHALEPTRKDRLTQLCRVLKNFCKHPTKRQTRTRGR
jgi:hypothetical protein